MITHDQLDTGLRDLLGQVARLKRQCIPQTEVDKHGLRYLSTEELVMTCGETFRSRITECDLPPMTAGNCFGNSMVMALRDHSLRYYEGWGFMEGSFPTHHAWLVDANGKVQDPTWLTVVANPRSPVPDHVRNLAVYRGVHIPLTHHVGWFMDRGTVNILANGEMVPDGLLEYGMRLFDDYDTGEVGVCPEMVKATLACISDEGQWVLDETTGIFTHSVSGRRWNGITQQFI